METADKTHINITFLEKIYQGQEVIFLDEKEVKEVEFRGGCLPSSKTA